MKLKHDINDADLKTPERMVIRICASIDGIAGAVKLMANAIHDKELHLK